MRVSKRAAALLKPAISFCLWNQRGSSASGFPPVPRNAERLPPGLQNVTLLDVAVAGNMANSRCRKVLMFSGHQEAEYELRILLRNWREICYTKRR
jgi:hypothetical protein